MRPHFVGILLMTSACMLGSAVFAQELVISDEIADDRGRLVEIQTNLNAVGIDVGRPDGIFGRGSSAGLVRFIRQFRPDDADYVLDAEVEAHLAGIAASYAGDPWADSSNFGGFTTSNIESIWDASDQVELCAERQCQAVPTVLTTGDLTGDGLDEIVYAVSITDAAGNDRREPSPILIMSPGGDGRYAPLAVDADRPDAIWRLHPRFAVIRDFNGDGAGDLFVAAHGYDHPPFPGEQNLLLLSGPAGLTDVSHANIPVQDDFAHGVDAGDLDGDGDIDIVVITNLGETRIDNYVLWNDGSGQFTQAGLDTILTESLALFLKPDMQDRSKYLQVEIEDIDKDGHLDLLLLTSGDNPQDAGSYPGFQFSRIVYGDGSGYWARQNAVELPRPRWGASTHTTEAAIIDIDSDGASDLVLGQSGIASSADTVWRGYFMQVLRSEGRKFVDVTADYMPPQGYQNEDARFPRLLMPADLDLDGRADLVVSTEAAWNPCETSESWRTAVAMLAQGDGTFRALDSRRVGVERCSGWNLAAVDADGDGDTDLVAGTALGEEDSAGRYRTYGMVVQAYLNDPTRRTLPPRAQFTVKTQQSFDDFPDDPSRVSMGLTSWVAELGDDFKINYNVMGRHTGGNFSALRFVLGDSLGDSRPPALAACGGVTEVWNDGEHHLAIDLVRSGDTFRPLNFDCLLDALQDDTAGKAAFLVEHFADIAIGLATPPPEQPVTNPVVLALMAQVAQGDLLLSR